MNINLITPPRESLYANHPRNITNKDWRKIVPVSDEIKQQIVDGVKKSFSSYGGMETDEFSLRELKNSYINCAPLDQQSYVGWTLDQFQTEEANRVKGLVKAKDPSWDFGQPVKKEVLEAIYGPSKLNCRV